VRRWLIAALLLALSGFAQEADWVCPMDPDVHSASPGKCPRCGMALVAGLPEALEYPVRIEVSPEMLTFRVLDPRTNQPVRNFEIVHEKLFHLFIVRRDLSFFVHEHPEPQNDGSFRYPFAFPRPGEYRLLCDFYPSGGTPQMIARTLIAPTAPAREVKAGPPGNLHVEMRTEPAQPLAGQKTMLFFKLWPSDGLEPYLGAPAHMLAVSADLIDMIHTHPAYAGPEQFNVIFPRPGRYRIWVQFQRLGVVNTAEFDVRVGGLQ
jgi:hypothetical protein